MTVRDRSELERWQDYELISCASISDEYLVRGRGRGKHLIFDLSVPRNVDPELGKQPGIRLFNIEQIDQLIQEKRCACDERRMDWERMLWDHVSRLARIYREKWEKTRLMVHA